MWLGQGEQEDSWVQGQRSKSPGGLGLVGTVRTSAFPLGEAGALHQQPFVKGRVVEIDARERCAPLAVGTELQPGT